MEIRVVAATEDYLKEMTIKRVMSGFNGTAENPIDIAVAALSVGLLVGYVRA